MDRKIFISILMIVFTFVWLASTLFLIVSLVNTGGTLGIVAAPFLVVLGLGLLYWIMKKACHHFFGKK